MDFGRDPRGWLIARLTPPDNDTACPFEWELFRSGLRKRIRGPRGRVVQLGRISDCRDRKNTCKVWLTVFGRPRGSFRLPSSTKRPSLSPDLSAQTSHVVPEPRRLHAYSWLSCGAGALQVWTSEWFLPKAICLTAGPRSASVIHDSLQASTSNVASNP